MRKLLWIFGFLVLLAGTVPAGVSVAAAGGGAAGGGTNLAQNSSREIAGALARLKNNPRYRGRILGTHVVRNGPRYLYEVRILRPDDRIILVYIDPDTGGVVGDSERSGRSRADQPRERRDRREGGNGFGGPRRALTPGRGDPRPFFR